MVATAIAPHAKCDSLYWKALSKPLFQGSVCWVLLTRDGKGLQNQRVLHTQAGVEEKSSESVSVYWIWQYLVPHCGNILQQYIIVWHTMVSRAIILAAKSCKLASPRGCPIQNYASCMQLTDGEPVRTIKVEVCITFTVI